MNSEWWSSLDTIAKVYWIIAIPSGFAFLLQLILTFNGGDVNTYLDIDAEIDGDTGIGFQFFTSKNLVVFFAIFSWVGIAC
ncbi:hypothetical protein OAD66_08515, partial [Bacteroidia bacterium]|nr:hypothetical protein [Bacteroidia bacterium]